ncbi:hypothetical protein FHS56_001847 [Thermonema lapsum]|uniref:DUF5723 domain-containing protein n=1 Tax=Thermonema lapsum TaxID=28195 RepID=A0A846MRW2_9BACT|nr:hypothetical protein [Thermonema lapsum]NIK74334.1 hypothetical protein [Thermonema lapsum]
MKKILLWGWLTAFAVAPAWAQEEGQNTYQDPAMTMGLSAMDSMSVFKLPFVYTKIGEQQYVGFRIQPEIVIWKIGVGFDVPLLWNIETRELRKDEFQNGVGVLRMMRYLRYGFKKRDKVYVKVGDMTGEYIGYGGLVNQYTNSPSFEKRAVGISADIRPVPYFGIEGLYGNLSTSGLLAVRPYVRPLATTQIPIAKTVEIGYTYLQDRDNTDYTKVFQDDQATKDLSNLPSTKYVRDGVSAWGIDMGVTVVNNSMLRLTAYTQYNQLNKINSDSLQARQLALAAANPEQADLINGYKAGTGWSIGAHAGINFIANIFNLDVRLERLWYSDYYQPQFFNAIYELNKDAKIESLLTTKSLTGTFGALTATIINKVRLGGGLLLPDNVSAENPAYIYLTLDANELIKGWIIQGSYIKGQLADLSDAFTLDQRSLAQGRLAYRFAKFLALGVDAKWTFARTVENGVEKFEVQQFIMPYFGLHVPFNLNK